MDIPLMAAGDQGGRTMPEPPTSPQTSIIAMWLTTIAHDNCAVSRPTADPLTTPTGDRETLPRSAAAHWRTNAVDTVGRDGPARGAAFHREENLG